MVASVKTTLFIKYEIQISFVILCNTTIKLSNMNLFRRHQKDSSREKAFASSSIAAFFRDVQRDVDVLIDAKIASDDSSLDQDYHSLLVGGLDRGCQLQGTPRGTGA